MIPIYELHPGSFIKSSTGTGIGVWTAGCYAGVEHEFTPEGWAVYKVDPEPLTYDILYKLGFKNDHSTYEFADGSNNGELFITWIDGEYVAELDNGSKNISVKLKYLHQLQNLVIVLFGKELKYNP